MKKFLVTLAASSLLGAALGGTAVAQDDDSTDIAVPVELFICSYDEGRGPDDLAVATAAWNSWADSRKIDNYSAWTLTQYYAGPDQDFDYIWLGVAPTAKELGAIQDDWMKNSGDVGEAFEKVGACSAHSNFASLEFKQTPQDDDPADTYVLSFSDCSINDGKNFEDVATAVTAWTEDLAGQGSESGHWIMFPVYGGGGEEYDFKWVVGHPTHEAQGVDWDNYNDGLANELFSGLLSCDSARVYNATNVRRAASDED